MFLLVGLGNPGPEYEPTRHNLGFRLVDRVAAATGCVVARWEHQALTGRVAAWGTTLLLAKPQTFMNLSGQSVVPLARYYRVPVERVLIACDDVDLPLGRIRLRAEGSSGGHRGLQSILESFGTQALARLRMGVGRPDGEKGMVDHVLAGFSRAEREVEERMLREAEGAAETVIREGIVSAMNRYNRRREEV